MRRVFLGIVIMVYIFALYALKISESIHLLKNIIRVNKKDVPLQPNY